MSDRSCDEVSMFLVLVAAGLHVFDLRFSFIENFVLLSTS